MDGQWYAARSVGVVVLQKGYGCGEAECLRATSITLRQTYPWMFNRDFLSKFISVVFFCFFFLCFCLFFFVWFLSLPLILVVFGFLFLFFYVSILLYYFFSIFIIYDIISLYMSQSHGAFTLEF